MAKSPSSVSHSPSSLPVGISPVFGQNPLKQADLLRFYDDMLWIRRFEEKAGQLYGMGLIAGFCHLYIGQEAVVVGVQSVLQKQDTVITAYRDHGHMLAAGMDGGGVMAELTGRSGGYSKGKGGSMHMFSREKNFFGGHGIVGAQVPLGAGLAFAHRYRGDNGVCVAYLGDGAVNQGQVYETFNMAALWGLPILFVIENNGYSMGTSLARHAAGGPLALRGSPYGIPGYQVDGMDVVAVQDAASMAVSYVRTEKKPMILEMKTYRYRGHSMSDPAKYRTKEEVEDIRAHHDPIDRIRTLLTGPYNVSDETLKTIEKSVKERVAAAASFAETSLPPAPSELYTDILIDMPAVPADL